jgi:hypothetical protein
MNAPAHDAVRLVDAAAVAAGLVAHPMAGLFSSPSWIEALRATYGFTFEAAALMQGGVARSAILFSRIEDMRGRRVLSLPFSDYCDPLVEDAVAFQRLLAPLLEMGAPLRLRSLRNPLPAADPRLQRTGTALWHGTDLCRDEAAMWAGLDAQARQNIRRAGRHGVTVRESDSLDDLRAFHRMHAHVRKSKYRMLAQPFALFESLHAAFAPSGRLTVMLAEAEGRPIAGILFLILGDTLYYKFNASLELALRPNDLLAWSGMRMGRERGLARLDFGLSDAEQEGLVRYKRKFATEEREIALLQWRPEGHAQPVADAAGRTLGRLTRLLTEPDVPDEISRAAGDELYRFFC